MLLSGFERYRAAAVVHYLSAFLWQLAIFLAGLSVPGVTFVQSKVTCVVERDLQDARKLP